VVYAAHVRCSPFVVGDDSRYRGDAVDRFVRVTPGQRRVLIVCGLLFLGISSCLPAWSPIEYTVGPLFYGTDATGQLTAIAANYSALQKRWALLGPVVRYEEEGALTWVCDGDARQLRSVGLVLLVVPGVEDTEHVADWQVDNFALHNFTSWYRVWISGADSATAAPADSLRASQAITPYCQSELDSLRAVPAASLTWSKH
jgi:hypothetical protein